MMSGYSALTFAIAHCQNSVGTISAMSQRNPSMPFAAQNNSMSAIFCHASGVGLKCVERPPASQ